MVASKWWAQVLNEDGDDNEFPDVSPPDVLPTAKVPGFEHGKRSILQTTADGQGSNRSSEGTLTYGSRLDGDQHPRRSCGQFRRSNRG